MKTLAIYDPAMCCPTGVCGTDVDPKLVQFASDLAWLQQQGVTVTRFNLAQQPAAFAENPVVRQALQSGTGCLPLLLVDGAIATHSIYPTREQLIALTGIDSQDSDCCSAEEKESEGCCGGDSKSGCCL